MKFETNRLILESISPDLARVILAGDRSAGDWHDEYPFEDELDPLRTLATSESPDPVFTMYMIRRKSDGLAIGGLGFFGPPDDSGKIEIGYGLVPSVRGIGFATEALRGALVMAAGQGARRAAADTDLQNIASQRVLEKAGFTEIARRNEFIFFELSLV